MKYLKIKNTGTIDEKSLYLLGASTKREDSSKIGMFGSGNKYALAFLLRNEYEVSIFSGPNKIEIGFEEEVLGGKTFKSIVVNGRNTGITTEFGKDWQLWQAIREIYCNAIDEGGYSMEYVSDVSPKDGETHFYIKTRPEVSNFFADYDSYFGDRKDVLFENKYGKILRKHNEKANIYRKGVKCFNSNKNSIFDYDFPEILIDENRLVMYSWNIEEYIWRLIYSCENKELIRLFIMNENDELLEKSISDWINISPSYVSQEFKECISEMRLCNKNMSGYLEDEEKLTFTFLPGKIFNSIRGLLSENNLGNRFKVAGTELYAHFSLKELHDYNLKKAKDFFKECNYEEPISWDMDFGIFDNSKILAFADIVNMKMIISKRALEGGIQELISAIIEEHVHLKYKTSDETRAMQSALIEEMVLILKIKNAYLV